MITHVETTPATTPDGTMTATIHQALAEKQLLPKEHFVDTAYVDAQLLVSSNTDHNIDLVGPVPPDSSWQAQAQRGFDISCFAVDWEQQRVTCPSGKVSQSWRNRQDEYGNEVVEVRFHPQDCRSCAFRSQCTRAPKSPRLLKLRPKALYQALQVARARQTSSDWKSHYGIRAGIEGTISQATRKFDLRRCRYIGLVKTQLQHTLTAAALNLTRVVAWLQEIPKAQTRRSRLAVLAPDS